MEVALFEFILVAEGLTRRRMLLYAALAAAVLAKGPIGVALPGLTILLWIAAERRWSLLRDLKLFRGALLVLVVAGGWYAAAILFGGDAFVHRQILAENLYRLLPNRAFHEPHDHPFYFVELALLAGYLPWTALLPLAILAIPKARQTWNPRIKYLVIWAATILIFYNLPRSKRGVYLLALYPALATLTALMLNELRSRIAASPRAMRLTALAEGLMFGVLALATLGMETGIWLFGPGFLSALLKPVGVRVPQIGIEFCDAINGLPLFAVLLPAIVCASAAYLIFARLDIDRIFMAVLAAISCSVLVAHLFVVPAIARTLTLKNFTRESMKIAGNHKVVDLGSTNFDVAFYAGRDILKASPGDLHRADYLICWQRYYGLLPASFRRQVAIVIVSHPTYLNGRGRMLLLKRSMLPTDDSSGTVFSGRRAVAHEPINLRHQKRRQTIGRSNPDRWR
jgi:hypothetical protein